jgi:hypothetical protein
MMQSLFISCNGMDVALEEHVLHIFLFKLFEFQARFKYLGFPLKPIGMGTRTMNGR